MLKKSKLERRSNLIIKRINDVYNIHIANLKLNFNEEGSSLPSLKGVFAVDVMKKEKIRSKI